jgi:hypothetical protein
MPLNCPDFDGHQVALKVVLVVQVVNAGAQHLESAFSVLVLLERGCKQIGDSAKHIMGALPRGRLLRSLPNQ